MTTHPDELAFLRAVCADPADDTVRLAFADWLQEHGEHERAEFIRVQIAKARDRNYHKPRCGGEALCRNCEREWELWRGGAVRGVPSAVNGDLSSFARGFVPHVTCPAADWLAHADALVWHPAQTAACPECDVDGVRWPTVADEGGVCPTCKGTGRVPRPFPATAQPVERVTLTGPMAAELIAAAFDRQPDGTHRHPRWPGVVFDLPPAMHEADVAADVIAFNAIIGGNMSQLFLGGNMSQLFLDTVQAMGIPAHLMGHVTGVPGGPTTAG